VQTSTMQWPSTRGGLVRAATSRLRVAHGLLRCCGGIRPVVRGRIPVAPDRERDRERPALGIRHSPPQLWCPATFTALVDEFDRLERRSRMHKSRTNASSAATTSTRRDATSAGVSASDFDMSQVASSPTAAAGVSLNRQSPPTRSSCAHRPFARLTGVCAPTTTPPAGRRSAGGLGRADAAHGAAGRGGPRAHT
jgi:hypothetical protein